MRGWNLIAEVIYNAKWMGGLDIGYYIWSYENYEYKNHWGWKILKSSRRGGFNKWWGEHVGKLGEDEIEGIIERDRERSKNSKITYIKICGGTEEIKKEIKEREREFDLLREIIE